MIISVGVRRFALQCYRDAGDSSTGLWYKDHRERKTEHGSRRAEGSCGWTATEDDKQDPT